MARAVLWLLQGHRDRLLREKTPLGRLHVCLLSPPSNKLLVRRKWRTSANRLEEEEISPTAPRKKSQMTKTEKPVDIRFRAVYPLPVFSLEILLDITLKVLRPFLLLLLRDIFYLSLVRSFFIFFMAAAAAEKIHSPSNFTSRYSGELPPSSLNKHLLRRTMDKRARVLPSLPATSTNWIDRQLDLDLYDVGASNSIFLLTLFPLLYMRNCTFASASGIGRPMSLIAIVTTLNI